MLVFCLQLGKSWCLSFTRYSWYRWKFYFLHFFKLMNIVFNRSLRIKLHFRTIFQFIHAGCINCVISYMTMSSSMAISNSHILSIFRQKESIVSSLVPEMFFPSIYIIDFQPVDGLYFLWVISHEHVENKINFLKTWIIKICKNFT